MWETTWSNQAGNGGETPFKQRLSDSIACGHGAAFFLPYYVWLYLEFLALMRKKFMCAHMSVCVCVCVYLWKKSHGLHWITCSQLDDGPLPVLQIRGHPFVPTIFQCLLQSNGLLLSFTPLTENLFWNYSCALNQD